MNVANAPLLAALAASILLLIQVPARLFPVIALVACAAEVLRVMGILSFKVPVVGAALVLGAAMVVGGVGSWVKAPGKPAVTAATIVVLVGLLRVLSRF